ncbi:MAG TPA: Photosystem II manganese-stabilizing polypeptide [Cyanobacteria bacterium UBA11049]|nr:Photosystem II manganese-stabilizing polypeptide [Cyanobacteria bacterium UBA11049]
MRYRALIVALVALCIGFITACSDGSTTASGGKDIMTYEQIRGTGLANKCPQLAETSRGSIAIDPDQSYKMVELCLEPTTFFIKEEPVNKRQEAEYVAGKLLTRYTSTIDQVQGKLIVNGDRSLTFKEEDGLDFQAITVQLPGGERVPFLFTIKGLQAQTQPGLTSINTSTDFEGSFRVPSYRGAAFLDPKGRGVVTGYDNAVALPGQADSEELTKTNIKSTDIGKGEISLQIAKVDNNTGEIAGTFQSIQPSDTDLGAKKAVDVRIRGLFYARIEPTV